MARPLRAGVQLPEVERDVRWPEVVAMARAAEEAGFEGPATRIAGSLRELVDAGADEAILVADPITERSIRDLGEALALLDAERA